MSKKLRKFTKGQGYNPQDLIRFGFDDLCSARLLFQSDPRCYHSAGYLTHLGIELILKDWILHNSKEFTDEHDLTKLYKNLNISLPKEQENYLENLQKFYNLRYPKEQHPIEIGTEDLEKIVILLHCLVEKMPVELLQEFQCIDNTQKGSMVLMYKEKHELDSN